MAEGFDNRQGGRATFAFQPTQPFQSRAGGGGQSRGADVRGGNSQGGGVYDAFTAPTDGGIPEFLQGVMEPYIQRKQQEQFFRGMTAAQSGQALDEIHKAHSGPLSSLLGPDHFEQGAAMYTAQARLNEWGSKLAADTDNLKKLPPEELSKVFAAASEEMMTGNPIADQAIQRGILAQSGPLVNTITKERVAWHQATRNAAHAAMTETASEGFEQIAAAQAALNDPAADNAFTLIEAEGNFLAQYQQPADMPDDDYRAFVYNSARNMLATGKMRAFTALAGRGLLRIGGALSDEQVTQLETFRDTQGLKLLGEAALDPEIVRDLEILHADRELGRITVPEAASNRLREINDKLARKTGVTWINLFDHKALVAEGNATTDSIVAAGRRIEQRQWQIEDREDAQRFQIEREEVQAAQRSATAHAYAASGDIKTGIAVGLVDQKDANVVFGKAVERGDFSLLARNFDRSGETNGLAANMLQTGVAASEGVGLTASFQRSHQQWQALDKLSPAAAMSYMGKYAARMDAYDSALKRGETAISAYAMTFGKAAEAGGGPRVAVSNDAHKAAMRVVRDAEGGMLSRLFGSGRPALSDGSAQALAGWIAPRAVEYAREAHIPYEVAAAKLHQGGLASGQIERAGPLGWQNATGQTPLPLLLKQPAERVDEAVGALVDAKLKATGVQAGLRDPAVWAMRVADRGEEAVLYVQRPSGDGPTAQVFVSSREITEWLRTKAAGEVAGNQPGGAGGFVSITTPANRARAQGYVDAYEAGETTDVGEAVKRLGSGAAAVGGVVADYAVGGPVVRALVKVRQDNRARRRAAKSNPRGGASNGPARP